MDEPMPADGLWLGLCRRLVRSLAWLAPATRRRDWQREWDGELVAWWRAHRTVRTAADRALVNARLTRRSVLAIRDALTLRAIERRSRRARRSADHAARPLPPNRRHIATPRDLMDHVSTDLRVAVRALRGRPTFALVAVLTLGLGIGASTLITSTAWTVLWRPLGYPAPEQVVDVWPAMSWSKQHFERLENEATSFDSLVLWAQGGHRMDGGDGSAIVPGPEMSAGLLRTLGASTALGRGFEPADERRDDAPVLLTHTGWQRRFGGDPAVIGRVIELDDRATEIIGVLPAGLDVLQLGAEVVVPVRFDPQGSDWSDHYLHVVARLAPGVSVAEADAELRRLAAGWRVADAKSDSWDQDAAVVSLAESRVRAMRPAMLLLLGAVACLLLVAAVNVAHLWLARALEREGEVTMRAVLGARPWRLVQQMLTETAVLAGLGGALGLGFAVVGIDLLRALLPADTPRLDALRLDGWTLLISLVITLGVGWMVALLPSLLAARRSLRPGSRRATAGTGRGRLRGALVVAELSLAVVLLVGAGMLVKSFVHTVNVDLGFDPRGLLTLTVIPEAERFATPAELDAYYRIMHAELAAVPGVTAVSVLHAVPVQNPGWTMTIHPRERPPAAGERPTFAHWRPVTADYFATAGMALARGRGFGHGDRLGGEAVAVLNETAARTLFPDGDALGRKVGFPFEGGEPITVVGVVRDVKLRGPRAATPLVIYRPYAQATAKLHTMGIAFRSVALRADGDVRRLVAPVAERLRAFDPGIAIDRVMTMDEVLAAARAEPRLVMTLVSLFAAAGLLLGAVGVYGVMECAVRERGKELSIRVALGADRVKVIGLVLGRGLRLALVGGLVGVAASWVAAGVLEAHLFEVSVHDPAVFVTVIATLLAVAIAASWWPARRAGRSDPIEALRAD